MKITPYTEQQLIDMNLLKDGYYDFEVIKSQHETSKTSGNEQIHLQLCHTDITGKQFYIHVYLVDLPTMAYLTKHFCDSAGLTHEYDSGILTAENCFKRIVWGIVKTKKDSTGIYKDKNIITDFVIQEIAIKKGGYAQSSLSQSIKNNSIDPLLNDEIPF